MCIVVDANSAHHMKSDDPDGKPVLDWLLRGSGKLVVSDDLLRELSVTPIRAILVTLEQARKLIRVDNNLCASRKLFHEESGRLRSDDPHVVALMEVSHCEVIFTKDKNLHKDLVNRDVIPRKCAIYQSIDHRHLLTVCRC
jgi:hypothetical protein